MRAMLVFGMLLLAGCAVSVQDESGPEKVSTETKTYSIGNNHPSGNAAWMMLNAFIDEAPRRYDNQFQHEEARVFLEERLVDWGYNTTRQSFMGPDQTQGTTEGQNILGVKQGALNNTIIFGAHFDSAITSVEAAYDDGTGTILVWELARAIAQRDWNHTIVIAGFDQEEAGLVGSSHLAQAMRDDEIPVTLMINYDMIGLNWPAGVGGTVNPIPVDFYVGGERENDWVQHWNDAREAAEYPAEATSSQTGLGGGSSDHGPFRNAEFDAAWMRGALIGSYPAYHNIDTLAAMTAVVGGEENVIAGFQTVLDLSYALLVELDALE